MLTNVVLSLVIMVHLRFNGPVVHDLVNDHSDNLIRKGYSGCSVLKRNVFVYLSMKFPLHLLFCVNVFPVPVKEDVIECVSGEGALDSLR